MKSYLGRLSGNLFILTIKIRCIIETGQFINSKPQNFRNEASNNFVNVISCTAGYFPIFLKVHIHVPTINDLLIYYVFKFKPHFFYQQRNSDQPKNTLRFFSSADRNIFCFGPYWKYANQLRLSELKNLFICMLKYSKNYLKTYQPC